MPTAIPRPRRNFTVEQKLHVARLVREQNLSVSAACQNFTAPCVITCSCTMESRPLPLAKLQRPVPSSVHLSIYSDLLKYCRPLTLNLAARND